jgi:hypothetical protein
MKLRWWIAGTHAVLAGGILIAKHFSQERKVMHYAGNAGGENIEESQPENSEYDFELEEYLA